MCILPWYLAVFSSCFFFSSRRRHTRCGRDWSSDVCSSDLVTPENWGKAIGAYVRTLVTPSPFDAYLEGNARALSAEAERSEERRVGKECRSRWSPYH